MEANGKRIIRKAVDELKFTVDKRWFVHEEYVHAECMDGDVLGTNFLKAHDFKMRVNSLELNGREVSM